MEFDAKLSYHPQLFFQYPSASQIQNSEDDPVENLVYQRKIIINIHQQKFK